MQSRGYTPYPLKRRACPLNKQQFKDQLRLRYNLRRSDSQSTMPCHVRRGEGVGGMLLHKKHDGIRNLLTSLLSKVCKNVEVEHYLLPIENEVFDLLIHGQKPWGEAGQKKLQHSSMYVLRMCTQRVTRKNLQNDLQGAQEREEKEVLTKSYWRGNGIVNPFVFGTNGGIGKECKLFLSKLAENLFRKSGESYASVTSWLTTGILFEILRSVYTCGRGSRI